MMRYSAKYLSLSILSISFILVQSQSFGQQISVESLIYLQESSARVRENIESMKLFSESETLSARLNQLDSVALLVDEEIANDLDKLDWFPVPYNDDFV